jgi:hypothetical protein
MSEEKNRPLETLRDGNVKASIWENTRENGVARSVQFRRSYQDAEGKLRDTDSFSGADLLRLARLAGQSYDRLDKLRASDRKAAEEPERPRTRDRDRGR